MVASEQLLIPEWGKAVANRMRSLGPEIKLHAPFPSHFWAGSLMGHFGIEGQICDTKRIP